MRLCSKLTHPIFDIVKQVSLNTGIKAYVVGGWVRDTILDIDSKDIDILCVGSGIDFANEVSKLLGGKNNVTVFKNFGTAMLNYYHNNYNWQIEFVGARKESYNRDSRKPIVEDGTLEDDLDRRDFTINALAISLSGDNYGELIDRFNGLEDIKNKIIRTPLDANITFCDDPLRMLRAIRFEVQKGFFISNETFDAIKENAYRVEILSFERITEELNKMILSPTPSRAFKQMDYCGILPLILPEISALKGVDSIGKFSHKDNFKHTLEVLDNVSKESNDLFLRWAALLHDIAKPLVKRFDPKIGYTFYGHEHKGAKMVKSIFRKLHLPLDEKMHKVEKLVALHLRPIILAEDIVTDSAIRRLLFDAGNDIDDLMILCQADITSKNYNKVLRFRENFKIVKRKLIEIEEKDRIREFQPPISGEDIMHFFNIPPSKIIGEIKNSIKDAILDGVIPNDREKAMQFMFDKAKDMGIEFKKTKEKESE